MLPEYLACTARITRAVLVLLCMGIFLVLLTLSWFTHPSFADDYCYATKFMSLGVVGGIASQYMEWSGGYTSAGLSGAIPVLFDFIDAYKFIPAILLLLTCYVAGRWVIAVCNLSNPGVTPWLMGMCFTVLFVSMMHSMVAGFYWFNGAMTYQVANILFTLMVVLVIRLVDAENRDGNRGRLFVYLGLATAVGMGCTETVMAAMFVFMNCICVWRLTGKNAERKYWVALLFITYTCFLIVALAPGNSVRANVSPNTFLLLPALRNAVDYGARSLQGYLATPQLWWASIIVLMMFCRLGWSREVASRIRHTHIAAGIMLTLAIPLVLCFPSWLALGSSPALRTQNSILYIFLLSWFGTCGLVAFKYLSRATLGLAVQPVGTPAKLLFVVAGLATCVVLISSENIRLATSDLLGKAYAYDQVMLQRYEVMETASLEGWRTAVVPGLVDPPLSINTFEIIESFDMEDFLGCFAAYFGVPRVVVE